jgi:hypothetical protein
MLAWSPKRPQPEAERSPPNCAQAKTKLSYTYSRCTFTACTGTGLPYVRSELKTLTCVDYTPEGSVVCYRP